MSVVCRPAREEDLGAADALVVSSINDLTQRHGFGPMAVSSPPGFQLFSMRDGSGSLWVAEEGERMLGFAWSWICGGMWFLAQLFVSPDHQGRGIGNQLIRRTLEQAETSRASNRVLVTFGFNTVSQSLYIRHGLLPRCPIYSVSISREQLSDRLPGPGFRFTPLENDLPTLRRLAELDRQVLGVTRETHHGYLLRDGATRGINLYDGANWAGYAYIDAAGHIGPLAVLEPSAVAPALRTALHLGFACGSSRISAFLPGASAAALGTAMEHGMRVKLPMLLMSSEGFGNWTQYLPRNPGFM
jgi:GNAT superfamily N-acetyltransferase